MLLLGLLAWVYWEGEVPTPPGLAATAIQAPKGSEEGRRAVIQLALVKGPAAQAQLRRVVAEARDPAVLLIAIDALDAAHLWENFPVFCAAMDHAELGVRKAAYAIMRRTYYSGALPENLQYQADDSPAQRARVVRRLTEIYHEEVARAKDKTLPH